MVSIFPAGARVVIDDQPCQGNRFHVSLYRPGLLQLRPVWAGGAVLAIQNMPHICGKVHLLPHGAALPGGDPALLLYISPADHGTFDRVSGRSNALPVLSPVDGGADQPKMERIGVWRAARVKLLYSLGC